MFIPPMIGLGTLALVSLVLLISIRSGSLTRNSAIGVRTKLTMRSDKAWSAGQRAAVPYLLAISVIAGAHMAALLMVELMGSSAVLGNGLVLSGFSVALIVGLLAMRAADKAAKAVISQGGRRSA